MAKVSKNLRLQVGKNIVQRDMREAWFGAKKFSQSMNLTWSYQLEMEEEWPENQALDMEMKNAWEKENFQENFQRFPEQQLCNYKQECHPYQ